MTLEEAVALVYPAMGKIFHGLIFVERVRHLIGRDLLYSDSALREMRRIKKRGDGNFRCINRDLSIYEKL